MSYIVYDRNTGDIHMCATLEEANEYVAKVLEEQHVPDELVPEDGDIMIARVTHRNVFRVTERATDYPCLKRPDEPARCSGCDESEECETTEEFSYSCDEVGVVEMEEVTE